MEKDYEYQKFRENIRTIISEKVEEIFLQKNLYESHSGIIMDVQNDTIDPYAQICNVDLVYTQIKGLLNKSGQLLHSGDSVVVFEKIGSHSSNCFIAFKNA